MKAPISIQEILVEDTHLVCGHGLVSSLPELLHVLLSLLVEALVMLGPEVMVP